MLISKLKKSLKWTVIWMAISGLVFIAMMNSDAYRNVFNGSGRQQALETRN